ncbi:hypothetical protein GGR50DRAFT_609892 [Xylaria sp. CBS 124048]|nr:hypothetical protein GGR50DRAFT_609892 [Xylaria sp. CBS 124048]
MYRVGMIALFCLPLLAGILDISPVARAAVLSARADEGPTRTDINLGGGTALRGLANATLAGLNVTESLYRFRDWDIYDEQEDVDDEDDEDAEGDYIEEEEEEEYVGAASSSNLTAGYYHPEPPRQGHLHIKKILCTGYATGPRINSAKRKFLQWGEAHDVGRMNWQWKGGDGQGNHAVLWICNGHMGHDVQVRCCDLEKAITRIQDKCGPGQGGIAIAKGKRREYGLGSWWQIQRSMLENPHASLCYRHICIEHSARLGFAECGRHHPPSMWQDSSKCRATDYDDGREMAA